MKQLLSILFLTLFLCNASAADKTEYKTFEVGKGTFLLNGQPFVIKSAELHYARIPRPYWEHRIKMCKALGMNTICIYIFWNIHEQKEGVFDWTGNNDVAEFCRLAQKNGMYIIVRPGPYACAEWEMGGLPWWLLKKQDVKLRSQDPYFLDHVKKFEAEVGKQLSSLTIQNGGPIIMMQVENEYGSYATDKPYISDVRDCLRSVGFDKTVLFQCDWSSNFEKNALPDLLWTMNFGTSANVLNQFKSVKQLRPDAPLMCSEYWSGWFDGWNRKHETRPATDMVNGIKTMLDNNISFSLYMAHGGTSFGQWAGANVPGYQPDCTSYDYDAPINEQGSTTEKYYLLRDLLQKYSATKLPAIPKPLPIISIPQVKFTEMAPLMRPGNQPQSIKSKDIKPMEQYDEGYGSILYSTTLPEVKSGSYLQINDVHDYAIAYINGEKVGELYRGSKNESTLQMKKSYKAGASLDIFVEEMGRINYSKEIKDPKGITSNVRLITTDGKNDLTYNLKEWDVTLYPVDMNTEELSYIPVPSSLENGRLSLTPAYYRTSFNITKTGDTYLDMSSWGKGMVWVNGHNIGRFWEVGPQQTLFLPGCWLKKGRNEIVVLDITGPHSAIVEGKNVPNISQLRRELMPHDGVNIEHMDSDTPKGNKKSEVGLGNDAAPGAK